MVVARVGDIHQQQSVFDLRPWSRLAARAACKARGRRGWWAVAFALPAAALMIAVTVIFPDRRFNANSFRPSLVVLFGSVVLGAVAC